MRHDVPPPKALRRAQTDLRGGLGLGDGGLLDLGLLRRRGALRRWRRRGDRGGRWGDRGRRGGDCGGRHGSNWLRGEPCDVTASPGAWAELGSGAD